RARCERPGPCRAAAPSRRRPAARARPRRVVYRATAPARESVHGGDDGRFRRALRSWTRFCPLGLPWRRRADRDHSARSLQVAASAADHFLTPNSSFLLSRHGRIANARAGKPKPCSTFGQVTTITAPVAGTWSRLVITSI